MPFPSLLFCTTLLCLTRKMPVVRVHCAFFPEMKNLFTALKRQCSRPRTGRCLCAAPPNGWNIQMRYSAQIRTTRQKDPGLHGRGYGVCKGASSGRRPVSAAPVTTLFGNCFRFVTVGAAPLAGRFCRQKQTFLALAAKISTEMHGFCAICTQNGNFLVYFTSGQNEINFLK